MDRIMSPWYKDLVGKSSGVDFGVVGLEVWIAPSRDPSEMNGEYTVLTTKQWDGSRYVPRRVKGGSVFTPDEEVYVAEALGRVTSSCPFILNYPVLVDV